ncbi:MAG: hypothetical protein ACP5QR_14455 [Rhizomicrobium sp.]
MNFLQLCQRMVTECGVSGTLSTTLNQVGEQARIVNWVNQGWLETQLEHDDWKFMRSSVLLGGGASFATVAGQANYQLGTGSGTVGIAAADFGKWDPRSFRLFTTSVGYFNEWFLDWITFEEWRDSYMLGAMRNVQTRSVAVAIGPDKSVCLGPPPNNEYTVTADYYTAPTQMSADTDLPTGLPDQYHMIIIYKAMQFYAAYEAAPEVQERGDAGYARMLAQLEGVYGPSIAFAGALDG